MKFRGIFVFAVYTLKPAVYNKQPYDKLISKSNDIYVK